MSNQKKFGVWMDNYNASIVGPDANSEDGYSFLAEVTGVNSKVGGSEKGSNNHGIMEQTKFFKEISSHLVNATHVHLTGTGQAQEQFMRFLSETPQFKNTATTECTSNKMSNERLVTFMEEKLK